MRVILLVCTLAAWASGSLAHSPLDLTKPENGAVLSQAPEAIVMDFKGKIRLTRVTVAYADQPATDLDLGSVTGFASDYSIPITPMGAGLYVIEWRGLGDDGHAQNGTFNFSVID